MSALSYYNEPAPLAWDVAAAIFGADGVGGLYDPSSLDTLFQDANGTTPAVPGSPVGLVLDKSGNSRNLSQLTTAARPILARMPKTGRRNLLTWTDLRGGAWAPSSSPDTVISPDAPDGFSKVSFTAPSTDRRLPSVQALQASIPQGVRVTVRALFRPLEGCTTIALGASNGSSRWSHAAYNIVTGESTIYTVSTAGIAEFKSAEEVSPGLWELVVTITAGVASIAGIYAHFGTGDATDLRLNSPIASCEIGEISLENGDTFNGYQRVTNAYDVTEEGVPDTYSLVYDLADDALTTTLPQSVNGDILIAGTKGSIIEPVSYAAGSTFTIGPDTYTGGTPGILRAIGDIVGLVLIDRELTQTERDVLIEHYKGKGAKGLLVPGPELLVNGTFDTDLSGWTDSSGEWFWEDGAAVINVASGSAVYLIQSGTPMVLDTQYLVGLDISESDGETEVRLGANASGAGVRRFQQGDSLQVMTKTGSTSEFYIRRTNIGGSARINTVSVRELRPQEDW